MKRLLLTIPLLLSTMAIGPCDPIPIGSLDGGLDGPPGAGGALMDAGTGGGGSGGSVTLPSACDTTGWSSETVFYAERAPADFSIDVDATGTGIGSADGIPKVAR